MSKINHTLSIKDVQVDVLEIFGQASKHETMHLLIIKHLYIKWEPLCILWDKIHRKKYSLNKSIKIGLKIKSIFSAVWVITGPKKSTCVFFGGSSNFLQRDFEKYVSSQKILYAWKNLSQIMTFLSISISKIQSLKIQNPITDFLAANKNWSLFFQIFLDFQKFGKSSLNLKNPLANQRPKYRNTIRFIHWCAFTLYYTGKPGLKCTKKADS